MSRPSKKMAPPIGSTDAADGLEQRRLAGAVGAEQGDDLALPHLEVDAEEHLHLVVGDVDAAAQSSGPLAGSARARLELDGRRRASATPAAMSRATKRAPTVPMSPPTMTIAGQDADAASGSRRCSPMPPTKTGRRCRRSRATRISPARRPASARRGGATSADERQVVRQVKPRRRRRRRRTTNDDRQRRATATAAMSTRPTPPSGRRAPSRVELGQLAAGDDRPRPDSERCRRAGRRPRPTPSGDAAAPQTPRARSRRRPRRRTTKKTAIGNDGDAEEEGADPEPRAGSGSRTAAGAPRRRGRARLRRRPRVGQARRRSMRPARGSRSRARTTTSDERRDGQDA